MSDQSMLVSSFARGSPSRLVEELSTLHLLAAGLTAAGFHRTDIRFHVVEGVRA